MRASGIEKHIGNEGSADQSGMLIGQVNTSRAKGRAYAKKMGTREDGAPGNGTKIVDFQLDRGGGTLAPEVTIDGDAHRRVCHTRGQATVGSACAVLQGAAQRAHDCNAVPMHLVQPHPNQHIERHSGQ